MPNGVQAYGGNENVVEAHGGIENGVQSHGGNENGVQAHSAEARKRLDMLKEATAGLSSVIALLYLHCTHLSMSNPNCQLVLGPS